MNFMISLITTLFLQVTQSFLVNEVYFPTNKDPISQSLFEMGVVYQSSSQGLNAEMDTSLSNRQLFTILFASFQGQLSIIFPYTTKVF